MKQSFIVLLLLSTVLGQVKCYGYDKDVHVKHMKEVFNGFDSDVENSTDGKKKYGNNGWEKSSFYRYYERFTFELDTDKKNNVFNEPNKNTLFWHVKRSLKIVNDSGVPGSHRDYGHCWIMGEWTFPYEATEILRKAYKKNGLHYSSETNRCIQRAWKDFCKRQYDLAEELLELGQPRAEAFASIVHCIHLLGDRETKQADKVRKVGDLVNEISEQAKTLFGDQWKDSYTTQLGSAGQTGRAEVVREEMIKLRFGTMLRNSKDGEKIKCRWKDDSSSDSLPHSH